MPHDSVVRNSVDWNLIVCKIEEGFRRVFKRKQACNLNSVVVDTIKFGVMLEMVEKSSGRGPVLCLLEAAEDDEVSVIAISSILIRFDMIHPNHRGSISNLLIVRWNSTKFSTPIWRSRTSSWSLRMAHTVPHSKSSLSPTTFWTTTPSA